MNDRRLCPCSACARHFRATERKCPFCDAFRIAAPHEAPLRPLPLTQLSRAALLAWGTTLGAIGCGTESDVVPVPSESTALQPAATLAPLEPPASVSPEPAMPAPSPPPIVEEAEPEEPPRRPRMRRRARAIVHHAMVQPMVSMEVPVPAYGCPGCFEDVD